MRMIDVDKLMEFAKNHANGSVDCNDIARFPQVDAEPVLHGQWIYHNAIPATCSVCGFSCGMYDDDSSDRYCSHCGAKMVGGETHAAD